MGLNGTDVMLYVNTGTPTVPVYEAVGSQRDATINRTAAEIDLSNKNDGADFLGEPGRRKSTIALDSLFVPTNAAYLALMAAWEAGENILVMRDYEGAPVSTAEAIVTSLSEKFPDQDAAIVSIGLTVTGAWTEVGT